MIVIQKLGMVGSAGVGHNVFLYLRQMRFYGKAKYSIIPVRERNFGQTDDECRSPCGVVSGAALTHTEQLEEEASCSFALANAHK